MKFLEEVIDITFKWTTLAAWLILALVYHYLFNYSWLAAFVSIICGWPIAACILAISERMKKTHANKL